MIEMDEKLKQVDNIKRLFEAKWYHMVLYYFMVSTINLFQKLTEKEGLVVALMVYTESTFEGDTDDGEEKILQ